MIISHLKLGFSSEELSRMARFLKSNYGASTLGYPAAPLPAIECSDYPRLLELMSHDKKNDTTGSINFTLLSAPGSPLTDQTADKETITAALDILRDML